MMTAMDRVLLIGSGGREHALAWRLSGSLNVAELYVAPGNAGTSSVKKTKNVVLDVKDFVGVASWCKENDINFVVIGPEDPLANGIVDHLSEKGIRCFGPTARAAQIEASKDFAKNFMQRHGIPTAKFRSFTDAHEACKFIESADFNALVVKASGLAAGKGVVVAANRQEACEATIHMMTDQVFGSASDTVVVEELLEGPEVSVLAFSDGYNVSLMPPAQDHKRLFDGDKGPNTGGMGAVCPYSGISQRDLEAIRVNVIEKTVRGLAEEGRKYVGVLYAGLMLTKDGPKVLEFNCRFGDPETQSILPLMTSDLYDTMRACVDGSLASFPVFFDKFAAACGVVLVSGGYPGSYEKGKQISGITDAEKQDGVYVFHAGTKNNELDDLVTNGGRVVAAVAVQPVMASAIMKAMQAAALVHFEDAFYRQDIGSKLIPRYTGDKQARLGYKDSGVDISAGNELVELIKPLAQSTKRKGCGAVLGGFGGLFNLAGLDYNDSDVLISSTCGAGKKLKYCQQKGNHFRVGSDLVAQCTEELLMRGAEPLYFLDYFATGKLDVSSAKEVIRGIAQGCHEIGCALIGGETAEMPSMYKDGDYDVAGMAVGIVHGKQLLPPPVTHFSPTDVVIGLQASSISQEDFSLFEEIVDQHDMALGDIPGINDYELIIPSKMWVIFILPLMNRGLVKCFQTTKHGLSRSLNELSSTTGHEVVVNSSLWRIEPLYGWLWKMSQLSSSEFAARSCCSIGGFLVVARENVDEVLALVDIDQDYTCKVVGHILPSSGEKHFSIQNLDESLSKSVEERLIHFQLGGKVESHSQNSLEAQVQKLRPQSGRIPYEPFYIGSLKLAKPVLVSSTDGVGTKLKIAQCLNKHNSVGQDLVAMCVNDVLASGAKPVFFSCYLATGMSEPERLAEVLQGVEDGCRIAQCLLTEEHISCLPSIYSKNVYDLGGFAVAAADQSMVMPRLNDMIEGDVVIGLPSSGLHSNGFSLVRKVIDLHGFRYDMLCPFNNSKSLGEELLMPTKIYVSSVLAAMHTGKVKSYAHITGGGLVENIPRAMPSHLTVSLDVSKWKVPPVFGWLQHMGKVSDYEMSRTFNCGLGAVLVVADSDVEEIMNVLKQWKEMPRVVGKVVEKRRSDEKVRIQNLCLGLAASWSRPPCQSWKKMRVAVLISGSGTNLQALIDHTRDKDNDSPAQICLVISNKPGVMGLKRAERAGITTEVIDHKQFKKREHFDNAIHERLMAHGIELICLAGFMRILTGEFVNRWSGAMLNIHPSLLPSFKGQNAQKAALEARVRISGCSVHFVAEEVDAGAIIVQSSVPVYPTDTEALLSERIRTVEHTAYPAALDLVASGQVHLGSDGLLVWNW